MSEEGYRKFRLHQITGPAPETPLLPELLYWRERLYQFGLIGSYPDGVGYGNLSVRSSPSAFIISGTATGSLRRLGAEHFTEVTDVDPATNRVWCTGPVAASSESMSHGLIYHSREKVGAVIHVHHRGLWENLLAKLPSTPGDVPYGTPEMAFAIRDLLSGPATQEAGLFAMAGHEEGVISFGESLEEAGNRLMEWLAVGRNEEN